MVSKQTGNTQADWQGVALTHCYTPPARERLQDIQVHNVDHPRFPRARRRGPPRHILCLQGRGCEWIGLHCIASIKDSGPVCSVVSGQANICCRAS